MSYDIWKNPPRPVLSDEQAARLEDARVHYKQCREDFGSLHHRTNLARKNFVLVYNETYGKPPQVEASSMQKLEENE